MAFLAKHFRDHDLITKGTGLPEHWPQYGAWLVLAELARRHPGRFSVIEGNYPAGGTVWFFLENSGDDASVLARRQIGTFNENGHIDIAHSHPEGRCPISEGVPEGSDQRLLTVAPVVLPGLREIVRDIEECGGIGHPHETPSSVNESIGWRAVSTILGLFLHSTHHLEVNGVLWDGVSPSRLVLENFPALSALTAGVVKWPTSTANAKIEPETAARLSHLVSISETRATGEGGPAPFPLLVVDLQRGVAHTRRTSIDLMEEYRIRSRSIESMAFHTFELALNAAEG
jgi:hypothetical protein